MDENTASSVPNPTSQHVYRVRLGWRLFFYLFATAAVGAICYLLFDYPSNPKDDLIALSILICFMLPLGISQACFAMRGCLTITEDTVELRSAFSVRSIRRDDIVGYGISRARTSGSRQVFDNLSLVARFNSPSKSGGSLDFPMIFDTDPWFDAWLKA